MAETNTIMCEICDGSHESLDCPKIFNHIKDPYKKVKELTHFGEYLLKKCKEARIHIPALNGGEQISYFG